MFKFTELDQIQVEITTRCQASCPMCPRNIHGGISNPTLPLNDWTVGDFKAIFNHDVLDQIKKVIFCGDFGEPTLNSDLPGMCEYLKTAQPDIKVEIFTNGGARSTTWWQELQSVLPENHTVVFGIDGLSDTHGLHRIGTDWHKIIANARSFITAGGTARWDFIRFAHNQHQTTEAEQLAYHMGFESFAVKDSRRFSTSFPVLDRGGIVQYYLDQPTDTTVKFINKQDLVRYSKWPLADKINCFVLKDREIYIDTQFTVFPCCIMGSILYTNYDHDLYKQYKLDDDLPVVAAGSLVQQSIANIIEEFGGLSALNAVQVGVKNIIETEQWQTTWATKWQQKTSPVCITMCSESSPFMSIEKQIVSESSHV